MTGHNLLIWLSKKYDNNWEEIYSHILNKKAVSEQDKEDMEKVGKEWEGKCITLVDYNYPEELKKTKKPPFVIYKDIDYKVEEIITLL